MKPKAEIYVRIDAEAGEYVATTPHVSDVEGRSPDEHEAVSKAVAAIRKHCQHYRDRGEPVPWHPETNAQSDQERIVLRLSGVAPANTIDPATNHEDPNSEE